MALSRALTTAGFRRSKNDGSSKSVNRRGTVSRPVISGPINLISTTNIMVQQAMAGEMAENMPPNDSTTISPLPLIPVSPLKFPSPLGATPSAFVPGSKPETYYKAPPPPPHQLNTTPAVPLSAPPGSGFSVSPASAVKSVASSSKTDSTSSLRCPSLVTDGSSLKSSPRNHVYDSSSSPSARYDTPTSPSMSRSSSTFSASARQSNSAPTASTKTSSSTDRAGMPSIPERAPSRTLHNHNRPVLSIKPTSPSSAGRHSHTLFSAADSVPSAEEPGPFSQEFEALDDVARDLSDTVKSVRDHDGEPVTPVLYSAADYLAMIAPLYQRFMIDIDTY